jgi:poly(hydroxyalkanoate) depolymerase family esterase
MSLRHKAVSVNWYKPLSRKPKVLMKNPLYGLMREATRLMRPRGLAKTTQAVHRAVSRYTQASTDMAQLYAKKAMFDGMPRWAPPADLFKTPPVQPVPKPARTPASEKGFTQGTHTHALDQRDYKLYVPPGLSSPPQALVVMLHGCTQNPDDFAAGTGMNIAARQQNFAVLYPAQSQKDNPSRCWNWFKPGHQQRSGGEPALIASLSQAIVKQLGIDPARLYVAGLSAGGAMAATLATTHPELFAAVGVHSGLPPGAASNVPDALTVMKRGSSARRARPTPSGKAMVPIIVFHGDQDPTVHPRNGEQVLAAALLHTPELQKAPRVEEGASPQGTRYTRTTHLNSAGASVAEYWLVHGAGHAWSGGHSAGSYTDPRGPSATQEILRFFFDHPHAKARAE